MHNPVPNTSHSPPSRPIRTHVSPACRSTGCVSRSTRRVEVDELNEDIRGQHTSSSSARAYRNHDLFRLYSPHRRQNAVSSDTSSLSQKTPIAGSIPTSSTLDDVPSNTGPASVLLSTSFPTTSSLAFPVTLDSSTRGDSPSSFLNPGGVQLSTSAALSTTGAPTPSPASSVPTVVPSISPAPSNRPGPPILSSTPSVNVSITSRRVPQSVSLSDATGNSVTISPSTFTTNPSMSTIFSATSTSDSPTGPLITLPPMITGALTLTTSTTIVLGSTSTTVSFSTMTITITASLTIGTFTTPTSIPTSEPTPPSTFTSSESALLPSTSLSTSTEIITSTTSFNASSPAGPITPPASPSSTPNSEEPQSTPPIIYSTTSTLL
ncbi:hypothetical protein P691DRAFT_292059 [Macrolepiota fuliginosa MF-IS2]|uniref:Uncharacterized protein n=1 Tax=Macrolepiota fuliginosa MF-IS2 TaxID=1400762 RepID=A0A9P5X825_9AGAR|nr:hypothetical protein P691DRAFT_292059 [Macrolepiota fuliginosa MF-IS2]